MATKEMCDEDSYRCNKLVILHVQKLLSLESIDINRFLINRGITNQMM
jgi:hypothetical protein